MSCCDDTDAWMKKHTVPVVNLVAITEMIAQAHAEGRPIDNDTYKALRRAIKAVKR